MKDIHILPINDLKEHSETRACWCKPVCERIGHAVMVTHNSADGRELVEEHGLQ